MKLLVFILQLVLIYLIAMLVVVAGTDATEIKSIPNVFWRAVFIALPFELVFIAYTKGKKQ